jgi:hypothetical protein
MQLITPLYEKANLTRATVIQQWWDLGENEMDFRSQIQKEQAGPEW